MREQRKSARTEATVQSASTLIHNQDTTSERKNQPQNLCGVGTDLDDVAVYQEQLMDLLSLLAEHLAEEGYCEKQEDEYLKGVILIRRIHMFISLLSTAQDLAMKIHEETQAISEATWEAEKEAAGR